MTERQRSRRALEREYALFANGPIVAFMWSHDPGFLVLEVSANCERLLGFTAEEIMTDGFLFADIVHPDDLSGLADRSPAAAADVDDFEVSYRLRRKDGEYIWVQEFTRTVRDTDGRIHGCRGYVYDQSQAKQLELALADQRARLHNVIEGTGVGTWEWNVQTGEVRFNERWRRSSATASTSRCRSPSIPGSRTATPTTWANPDTSCSAILPARPRSTSARRACAIATATGSGCSTVAACSSGTTTASRCGCTALTSTSPGARRPRYGCARARAGCAWPA